QSDYAYLLSALGRMWVAGGEIDWESLHEGERRRRVPLPTYPFERVRCWIDPPTEKGDWGAQQKAFERRSDIADWFYVPSWKRSILPEPEQDEGSEKPVWLIFSDECGLGAQITERLERDGELVVEVKAGSRFSKLGERT